MTFVVDGMLGKLAKWLRILGFDAVYFSQANDDDLLRIALKEGRTLLTRDTALLKRCRGIASLLIESERWKDQVRQVLEEFGLWSEAALFSRCLECNAVLKLLSSENARNLVAPFVHQTAERFSICPECGRVYWKGTHFRDMEAHLEEIFKESPGSRLRD